MTWVTAMAVRTEGPETSGREEALLTMSGSPKGRAAGEMGFVSAMEKRTSDCLA